MPTDNRCHSCEVLYINGVRCHESGCPDAWKDEERECEECGQKFEPEVRHDRFCSPSCCRSYYYIPNDEEE